MKNLRDNKGRFAKGFKFPKEWAEKRIRPKGLLYKRHKENPTSFKLDQIPWNKNLRGREYLKHFKDGLKGTFRKGEHCSPQTEFKRGQNSREKNFKWNGGNDTVNSAD